jgi:cyanophycin synthetase
VNAGATNVEIDWINGTSVHPDNIRLAIDAAQTLRLDFAGVDLIISDIGRSWHEVGALICEINGMPQMGGWKDSQLYQRVLKDLFGGEACVPSMLRIIGEGDQRSEHVRDEQGQIHPDACISTTQGLWCKGARISAAFADSFDAARAALHRHDAKQVVCLMSVQDAHKHGLPIARWDAIDFDDEATMSATDLKLLSAISNWPLLRSS